MALDMEAIWLLAETRSEYGLECARKMLRRISFNDAQACVTKLWMEHHNKPVLEQKLLP